MSRIGLYAWGGPGTIRLLNTKYHTPRIDTASYMRLYEPEYLRAARDTLGVTDMWVTYSWGFADATEGEDWRYITERLPHFAQHGIQTHAYVQGLNVVTREFADQDIFCRDAHGRLQPYSRGRSLTCPNNPAAAQMITDRVRRACDEAFDGVYVDNIQFGLPPFFVRRDYMSFFGCSCRHCQERFRAQFGYALPVSSKAGAQVIADYLAFRVASVGRLLTPLAELCRSAGKQFGINLYDPLYFTPPLHFGYGLPETIPLLDYLLVENHALHPTQPQINNAHIKPLIDSADQPVFVVSYREGISYDAAYSQADIDMIWSDAAALGYSPCLKATEYVTDGVWHALDIDRLRSPIITPLTMQSPDITPRLLKPRTSALRRRMVGWFSRYYPRLATAIFESRLLSRLYDRTKLHVWVMRTDRVYRIMPSEE